MYNIIYSKDFLFDLEEISDFISFDNPFYAKKVIDEIYNTIEFLEKYPYI